MRTEITKHSRPNGDFNGTMSYHDSSAALLEPWMDKPDLFEKHLLPTNNSWMMLVRTAFRLVKGFNANITELNRQIAELRIRNEELEFLADKDILTGLKNRRGFEEAFAAELDRIKRGTSKAGLILTITLDNFSTIQDIYGNRAKDECLELVGRYLTKTIRKMDTASRLKDDEFVVLFSNTREKDALDRAQQISVALNSLKLDWFGKTIPLHMSVGLKSFDHKDDATILFEEPHTTLRQNKPLKKAVETNNLNDMTETINLDDMSHADPKQGALVKEILASLSA